jgi:hypothetical protein
MKIITKIKIMTIVGVFISLLYVVYNNTIKSSVQSSIAVMQLKDSITSYSVSKTIVNLSFFDIFQIYIIICIIVFIPNIIDYCFNRYIK